MFLLNVSLNSTRNKVPPSALVWCGMESVVCHWEGVLLMVRCHFVLLVLSSSNAPSFQVGPYGHQLRLPYDDHPNLLLVSEIDGLRIITNTTCEYLQRVPPKTEAIFKVTRVRVRGPRMRGSRERFAQIGSTHPAAMLYDACVAFSEKSPKADENIRYIRGQNALDDAVLGAERRLGFVEFLCASDCVSNSVH